MGKFRRHMQVRYGDEGRSRQVGLFFWDVLRDCAVQVMDCFSCMRHFFFFFGKGNILERGYKFVGCCEDCRYGFLPWYI